MEHLEQTARFAVPQVALLGLRAVCRVVIGGPAWCAVSRLKHYIGAHIITQVTVLAMQIAARIVDREPLTGACRPFTIESNGADK